MDLARTDDDGWPSPEVTLSVQDAGMELPAELRGYGKPDGQPLTLPGEAEDRLVRLCHLASRFEAIYRLGGFVRGNTLGNCAPGATLDDLLEAVPATSSRDITGQMTLAAHPAPSAARSNYPPTSGSAGPSSTAVRTSAARTRTSSCSAEATKVCVWG